ncbi:MAG: glutamate--tRNA ligase family protein, partial [SAR324 cluster bacterium]|nr:glutamate--tRNA ligase family protein [SAR324 cluster bacterium]
MHLGNACNFLLTWLWIRYLGGELWLRIDDLDQARVRPEYIEDIFQQLDWLGLDTDQGPRSVAALQQSWSQQLRTERYLSGLTQLNDAGALYRCTCSRRQWKVLVGEEGCYPGTCRQQQHSAEQPGSWRIRLPAAAMVRWQNWPSGQEELDLADEMGDFVIQRRDGQVAYQLVSCLDDLDWQMNLLIRGVDLRPS